LLKLGVELTRRYALEKCDCLMSLSMTEYNLQCLIECLEIGPELLRAMVVLLQNSLLYEVPDHPNFIASKSRKVVKSSKKPVKKYKPLPLDHYHKKEQRLDHYHKKEKTICDLFTDVSVC